MIWSIINMKEKKNLIPKLSNNFFPLLNHQATLNNLIQLLFTFYFFFFFYFPRIGKSKTHFILFIYLGTDCPSLLSLLIYHWSGPLLWRLGNILNQTATKKKNTIIIWSKLVKEYFLKVMSLHGKCNNG